MSGISEGVKADREASFMEMTSNNIRQRRNEIDRISERIHNLADKIIGGIPETNGEEKQQKTEPGCAMDMINFSIRDMERSVSMLMRAMDRLEEVNIA